VQLKVTNLACATTLNDIFSVQGYYFKTSTLFNFREILAVDACYATHSLYSFIKFFYKV